jgi:stearoyl-CoA desaturase (delta-9 desaturase)
MSKGPASGWLDNSQNKTSNSDRIDWYRIVPFILVHLACLAVFYVGFSWVAFWTAVGLYVLRMFAITGWFHRYFAHRNFKTSRPVQFIFAFIGTSSAQRSPLWWASHHRAHHVHSDTERDIHSPRQQGFVWSHMLWFLSDKNFSTDLSRIKDFAQYPELRWLDRYDIVPPVILGALLFGVGWLLEIYYPELGTTAGQMLVWGMFISTVVLYHATYTINSLCHQFGSRRFKTKDDSRNNFWLALITLGEGWHNNHHFFPATVRQGFKWWEIDITFYILKLMSFVGLVWDLQPIPERVKKEMASS